MPTSENFVARWARLKRDAGLRRTTEGMTEAPSLSTSEMSAGSAETAISQPRSDAATVDELFDPVGLPPIEAITANTDISGFLQSRIPAELTRAALRRAWVSDPAIRDFIGIAENQWDFNDPNAIPGFAASQDSAPALSARVLGTHGNLAEIIPETPVDVERSLPATTHTEPADLDQSAQPTFETSPSISIGGLREDGSGEGVTVGTGPVAEGDKSRQTRRSHGGALPR